MCACIIANRSGGWHRKENESRLQLKLPVGEDGSSAYLDFRRDRSVAATLRHPF